MQKVNVYSIAPLVNIVPPVATIFTGQPEINLRCTTNSDQLPITWISSNLLTELSSNPLYTIAIPRQTGFPDLTSFTCIVRDPEVSLTGPSNIVGRADAYVRNINGKSVSLTSDTISLNK